MHNKILNKYYFINKFDQSHLDKQDNKTTIIFRNYDQIIDEKLILKLKSYCKKKGNKFLLSNNVKLAMKLNLDGAYIPSFNKNKNYLGINKFKSLSLLSDKPFIALGGISNDNLKKLALTNCNGFAGISFFEQKKGP